MLHNEGLSFQSAHPWQAGFQDVPNGLWRCKPLSPFLFVLSSALIFPALLGVSENMLSNPKQQTLQCKKNKLCQILLQSMTFPAHGWRKCRSPAWRSHLSWSCFMSKPVSYILFLASNKKKLSSSDPHRSDLPSGNMWHNYIAYIYILIYLFKSIFLYIYIYTVHEYSDILSVFWHILWHSIWHFFVIMPGIYSDILSGILSDILFWHSLCSGPGPAHCIYRQGGGTRMEEEEETLHLCVKI